MLLWWWFNITGSVRQNTFNIIGFNTHLKQITLQQKRRTILGTAWHIHVWQNGFGWFPRWRIDYNFARSFTISSTRRAWKCRPCDPNRVRLEFTRKHGTKKDRLTATRPRALHSTNLLPVRDMKWIGKPIMNDDESVMWTAAPSGSPLVRRTCTSKVPWLPRTSRWGPCWKSNLVRQDLSVSRIPNRNWNQIISVNKHRLVTRGTTEIVAATNFFEPGTLAVRKCDSALLIERIISEGFIVECVEGNW